MVAKDLMTRKNIGKPTLCGLMLVLSIASWSDAQAKDYVAAIDGTQFIPAKQSGQACTNLDCTSCAGRPLIW